MNAATNNRLFKKYELLAKVAHKLGAWTCAKKWSEKAERVKATIEILEELVQKKEVPIMKETHKPPTKPPIEEIASIAKKLATSKNQKDKALAACLFATIASYQDEEIMGLFATISNFAHERGKA